MQLTGAINQRNNNMNNFKLKPGSKELDTPGNFNKKQTDTLSRLNKPVKISRKARKLKEAKKKKFENYVQESKQVFPDFDQKKDSVVSTTGRIKNVVQAHNRMKAKSATLPPVSLKPGETVTRNFIPGKIDYNNEKTFKNRKTGEFTSKMKVKKNSATILKK
mgnify:CR=1 FL=1